MAAIEVAGLTKAYTNVHTARGVSFSAEDGVCVAVLGPHGAGNTTTVEIVEGYRTRDAGNVTLLVWTRPRVVCAS